jgi:hypothetical protein
MKSHLEILRILWLNFKIKLGLAWPKLFDFGDLVPAALFGLKVSGEQIIHC